MHPMKLSLLAASLALGTLAAPQARAASDQADRAALEKQLADARKQMGELRDQIRDLSRKLGDDGTVMERTIRISDRAMIGVTVADTDDDDAPADGARVAGVTPGGPAADAGLRSGDLIVAIDGKSLKGDGDVSPFEKLRDSLDKVKPGDEVTLKVSRDGKTKDYKVKTERFGAHGFAFAFGDDRPDGTAELWMPRMPIAPAAPVPMPIFRQFARGWGDLEMVSLSDRLGGYFGTKDGVLVVHAPHAEGLDLQDGDVILKIGERTPTSPEQVSRILRSYEPGDKLKLEVMRDRKRITLDARIPDHDVGMLDAPAGFRWGD